MQVKPYGPISAPFIIIGGQPGKMEIHPTRGGRPFCGPEGRELHNDLDHAGIDPASVYFTYVIQDLPPMLDHFITIPKQIRSNKQPQWTEAGQRWLENLKQEISSTQGILIPLGNIALFALTGRWGIEKWAGSVIESSLLPGRRCIPSLHPETIVFPRNQYLNKYLLIKDLKRAVSLSEGLWKQPDYSIKIKPSYQETLDFLYYLKQKGLSGKEVAYDIEVSGRGLDKQVSCISFSVDCQSISIPFVEPQQGGTVNYWFPDQEAEIWTLIAQLLQDPDIIKLGQNLAFDNHFLFRRYGIVLENFYDTMVAQNILLGDFPKGLDFITRYWTDLNYYKADGKDFITGASSNWEKFWIYNGLDSVAVDLAWPNMKHFLIEAGNWEVFSRQCQNISILTFMQERGIKVDVEGLMDESQRLEKEKEKKIRELEEIVCDEYHGTLPDWYTDKMKGSGKQLTKWFHDRLKSPRYKTVQGKEGFDVNVLKRLIRKEFKGAKEISAIRKLEKLSSTYTDLNKIDPDGRVRCSYNPAGTRYARLSSSKTIFGTGMNLQNWPHILLKFLVADDGYVFYFPDLGQAENRIVAYIAGEEKMIQAFEQGMDVHSLTASLISDIDPKTIREQDDAKPPIPCPLGDGTKTWRFWGKKANHGLNYDLGYRKFAFYYEIPENEGKFIVEKYHKAYPSVRRGLHSYVRACLKKNRTIPNLLGRNLTFLGKLEDNLFKECYACIPQGTVGDIMHKAMRDIDDDRELDPVEIQIQIHDSLGFQIPLNLGWKQHAYMLLKIKRYMEIPLTAPNGLKFTIPADFVLGKNLRKEEGRELKGKNFPLDVDELALSLEENWNKLA